MALMQEEFDLLLLDMTLPIRERSGRYSPLAGQRLLHRAQELGIACPTVIVTAFLTFNGTTLADLEDQLQIDFAPMLLGVVHLDLGSTSWQVWLERLVG